MSEVGGRLVGLSPEAVRSAVMPVSVRIELQDIQLVKGWLVVEGKKHTSSVRSTICVSKGKNQRQKFLA